MAHKEEYEGPERREDYIALDKALAEVQKLHGSVITLANAVVNTVPRSELEDLKQEVKKDFLIKMYSQAILTVVALVILLIMMNRITHNLGDDIKAGHEVIVCLQGKAEAERTGALAATAQITCEQTTR
jgi:hypothetical protein